jgi:hypothetical protein
MALVMAEIAITVETSQTQECVGRVRVDAVRRSVVALLVIASTSIVTRIVIPPSPNRMRDPG